MVQSEIMYLDIFTYFPEDNDVYHTIDLYQP